MPPESSALARLRLRACNHVGRGVVLRGAPRIINGGYISVGDGVRIDSLPIVSHLATGPRGRLEVADDVRIGAGAAIAAHVSVRILQGATLGPGVMVLDTDFHAAGGAAGPARSEPILIGRSVRIGARVTVLRGARIGDGAVVDAGSVVSGEIAADSRVAGVPARVQSVGASDGPTGDVRDTVRAMVRDVLRLDELPTGNWRTRDISAWDSLGALNLLLSLEQAFRVTLRPDEVTAVQTIDALESLVARAVDAREGGIREG